MHRDASSTRAMYTLAPPGYVARPRVETAAYLRGGLTMSLHARTSGCVCSTQHPGDYWRCLGW
jgi:hypothetical protein